MEASHTSNPSWPQRGSLKRRVLVTASAAALMFAGSGMPVAGAGEQVAGPGITTAQRHRPAGRAASGRPVVRPARPVPRLTRPARRSTQPPAARLHEAEAIADSSGWDWRRAGIAIRVGFHPEACCHWGVYDSGDSSLWIGPTAFANATRLRYTVLHELGHAWQWHSGRLESLAADMARWGHRGGVRLEAGADCMSVVWGASRNAGRYWACPPGAAGLVARRLAGDWSS